MQKVRGIARRVDSTVIDHPGQGRAKRTVHISTFQINGQRIKFESTKPQMINDGDDMLVVGDTRSSLGLLNAKAYRNFTTGVEGHQGLFIWLAVGVAFSSSGLAFIGMVTPLAQGVGAVVVCLMFGGIFILLGGIGLYSAARTFRAVRELRKDAP